MFKYAYLTEKDLDTFQVPEGYTIATMSNIGAPKGTMRVSMLPVSVLRKHAPVEGVDFIYKTKLDEGDESKGIKIIHPDTNEILTFGDYSLNIPFKNKE